MDGRYSLTLVALSVATAMLASYAALALAARVAAAQGRFRAAWLLGGSIAVGVGLWSLHFVGMLSLRLPAPTAYDVETIVHSALVAIGAAGVWLYAAGRAQPRAVGTVLAGFLVGGALAALHYVGMAALRIPAAIRHAPAEVALSLGAAVLAALAALGLSARFSRDETPAGRRRKAVSAVAIGLALAGMHYTAMASLRFGPLQAAGLAPDQEVVLPTTGLAVGVAAASVALLAAVLAIALADRRAQARDPETEAVVRSEQRFRALVEASAQIVWTRDRRGELVDPQPTWEHFTGMSFEEYRGRGWLQAVHPADRDAVAAQWTAAAAAGVAHTTEYRLRRSDGEWRHMAVRAVPVLGPDGGLREWVGTSEDVTERRNAELGRAFLAEAGRVLGSSLDPETTLRSVARLAVPRLADWCAVDLVDEHGQVHRVAVEHADPEKVAFARQLQERYPPDPDSEVGVPAVLRTGRTDWMAEIPDALLESAAVDGEHLRLMRDLGLRSYVAAPLVARGHVLGVLTLVHAEGERRFDEQGVALVEELADRAAVAVDNARLYRETEDSRVQLEQQAGELQEAQAEMEMAHDELQRANEDLLQRTREAEEANHAKSQFLATMSHELRTPLNAISGYAELLEMGVHGPLTGAQREALARIRRNQVHLLGLINDVLNFARLEAGQVAYDFAAVPLDASLATLESLVQPQLRAQRLRYRYRPGDGGVAVWADRERMEQIVLNLLTNAIKFTEAGGEVRLEWEPSEDVVRIRVTDTGVGIPPDKVGTIFEPFVQVDSTLTRSTEGTGLGLSISRDLARAMGGDISVESEPGRGSVFTLTLPRAKEAGRDAA